MFLTGRGGGGHLTFRIVFHAVTLSIQLTTRSLGSRHWGELWTWWWSQGRWWSHLIAMKQNIQLRQWLTMYQMISVCRYIEVHPHLECNLTMQDVPLLPQLSASLVSDIWRLISKSIPPSNANNSTNNVLTGHKDSTLLTLKPTTGHDPEPATPISHPHNLLWYHFSNLCMQFLSHPYEATMHTLLQPPRFHCLNKTTWPVQITKTLII